MKIIAVTGMPWSGKSEAVRLAKEQGIPVIRMGDLVWEETKRRGLDLSDQNVGSVAHQMRQQYGNDVWAKKTVEKLQNMQNSDIVLIDGIRTLEEVAFFTKQLSDDFVLIAVDACDKTRYKRAKARGREDDTVDIEVMRERDRRERGWGLGEVIAAADIVIVNEQDIDTFRREITKVFDRVLKR
jgi:dephospho-CoA kinase